MQHAMFCFRGSVEEHLAPVGVGEIFQSREWGLVGLVIPGSEKNL